MMLARFYFQQLCEDLQSELVMLALEKAGIRTQSVAEELEDIDDYINRHNQFQTIPEWFETIEKYDPR